MASIYLIVWLALGGSPVFRVGWKAGDGCCVMQQSAAHDDSCSSLTYFIGTGYAARARIVLMERS